jgi:competence ComEA-like helix-hairpin-helix protein
VKKLGDVVEDCVNKVGVELNTASAQLLGYVAGIGPSLAKKIVVHRDTNGKFTSRAQLTDVSGLGPKTFEQAAGFLRIPGSSHPLDASAVHPERYALVEKMAADLGVELPQLIGNQELVDKIDLSAYVQGDEVGLPTLQDIAAELSKPGRDPRAEFAPPRFRDDVTSMEDLKQGMILEGIVTNVTAFGAFVDIGVHNDGLVHVSQLSDQFVKDPSEVVKVGQKMTVRVLEVDLARKRIGLSAKRGGQPKEKQPRPPRPEGQQQGQNQGQGGNRRGGRGRGGQNRPHPDQQQGQAPNGEGQHAQGGQGAEGQQGERRPWRERGPRPDQQQQGAGGEQRGGEQRGGEQRTEGGPRRDDRGPRRDDRGPGGPRRDDRGPRQGDRGPGGPRRDDRGPQQQGQGGGGGGGGGGGPRRDDRGPDGPRRDDRGPGGPRRDDRRDDRGPRREGPPPENWGISGFTNNPFAKLQPGGDKNKR